MRQTFSERSGRMRGDEIEAAGARTTQHPLWYMKPIHVLLRLIGIYATRRASVFLI